LWKSEAEDARISFDLRELLDKRRRSSRRRGLTAVLDGGEGVDVRQLNNMFAALRNWNDVDQVIVTSRIRPDIRIYEFRELSRPSVEEMEAILRGNLNIPEITEEQYLRLLGIVKGSPEAAVIMAGMARSLSSDQLRRVLSGKIYDLTDVREGVGPVRVAQIVKPLIVVDNERLLKALKQNPKDVFKLSPRQFEEVVADLLQDMDYDVTLTKQTNDGGADILAAKKTEVGDVLCLVDAKKYKESRKIGVGMVRTLLGTLEDYRATSAMLATTSTYSPKAKAMQEKHQFRLSLKDYTDVVGWIQNFREKR
jgi:HJR/Mrr/RecB family endonuclease